ncbi:tyrosine-protein phosphatase [Oxalobacter sp. OttesenSCG-928-P03]|nr:tyrosine-protein phosphatase [Oxalobacter sp. OttesenSCG-928-P03]
MSPARNLLAFVLFILTAVAIIPAQADTDTPGKRITLEKTWNTRDLGGYTGVNGKKVISGKLFRTDELASLTEKDQETLSAIPLAIIVDFRSIKEQQAKPDRLPKSTWRYYLLPITPGKLSDLQDSKIDESIMIRAYREMVSDSEAIAQYREFFRILQSDSNEPVAFHCAAGKDRTGIAAALILYSLGVDEKTIMEDYLLSAGYISGKYAGILKKHPAYAPLLTVRPAYLEAAFQAIRNRHGSIENYLQETLQVNPERMQEKYLQ